MIGQNIERIEIKPAGKHRFPRRPLPGKFHPAVNVVHPQSGIERRPGEQHLQVPVGSDDAAAVAVAVKVDRPVKRKPAGGGERVHHVPQFLRQRPP